MFCLAAYVSNDALGRWHRSWPASSSSTESDERWFFAVLHQSPVTSPVEAVRAALWQSSEVTTRNGGTVMPARVIFVQKIGSGPPMPEAIAEYSGGVIISTKADIGGYGFASVGILLDDDTFNKLALAMIEANTKKAIRAFEAAIQGEVAAVERSKITANPANSD